MPELPEVETVARGLRAGLLRARIDAIAVRFPGVVRARPRDLAELEGARLAAVDRAGKYLVLALEASGGGRWQLMIHLGMTGKLLLLPPGAPPARHTHVIFSWSQDAQARELHFTDPRRFGKLILAPAPPGGGYAPALGVAAGAEPLLVSEADFLALYAGRQAPLKNALLNQKLLRGLGNIYADESLFRAGIDPRAKNVSRPRLRRLRAAIHAVLTEAVEAGGSSISDYVSSAGEPGWFQLRHRVYGRTGQPCPDCGTPIQRVVLAGRSAHFCARCQKR